MTKGIYIYKPTECVYDSCTRQPEKQERLQTYRQTQLNTIPRSYLAGSKMCMVYSYLT